MATQLYPYLGRIEISSHNFEVSKIHPTLRPVCVALARSLVHWGLTTSRGQTYTEPKCVFAVANSLRTSYRFHIHSWKDFEKLLGDHRIKLEELELVHREFKEPVKFDFASRLKPGFAARDYQQEEIDYITKPPEPFKLGDFTTRTKLTGFATGLGKTLTSQLAMVKLGLRTVIIVKGGYVSKWYDDMMNVFNLKKDEITLIAGNKSLLALLDEAQRGVLKEGVIIVSMQTFQAWVRAHEKYGDQLLDQGYPCTPDKFLEHVGAGVRLIDECHQLFHFVFKIDLYSHVGLTINLSATLTDRDPFLLRMYDLMFPKQIRGKEKALDKYIDVTAILYEFDNPDKIRTTVRGSNLFNQGAFEESIIRQPKTLKNYLDMIAMAAKSKFDQVKREKKKLFIYAYLTDMVDLIVDDLSRRYPDKKVLRYVSEDPYENIELADICVTTLGSAGTALDIPDLTNTILTTNVSSVKANLQFLGRLRQLRDKHPVAMQYLVASNIPVSMKYHYEKKDLFSGRVKSHNIELYGPPV